MDNKHTQNCMTDSMLQYAMSDAAAGYDVVFRAAEMLDADPADFIQCARLSMADPPQPLRNGRLLQVFSLIQQKRMNSRQKHLHRNIRENHDKIMVRESIRRTLRHSTYAEKRDAWRDANGYTPI